MRAPTFAMILLLAACAPAASSLSPGLQAPPPGTDADGDGVPTPEDCFDADPTVYPGADEIPADGIDQDCDGVDVCFYDFDGDGFGAAATPDSGDTGATPRLVRDSDLNCRNDSALTADNATDCDDTDPTVYPGADELDADGIDQDCDGVDVCYRDDDGDGFGDVLLLLEHGGCLGEGTAAAGDDCDDARAAVNPDAIETCNGIDDDCDGTTDAGVGPDWFRDLDGDGFGDPEAPLAACDQPPGYVDVDTDCLDNEGRAFPGNPEVCDAVDNDCNGEVDDDPIDLITWRPDRDEDGFPAADESVESCFMPQDGRLWLEDDGTLPLDGNDLNFFVGGCSCDSPASPGGAGIWLMAGLLGWGRRHGPHRR